MAKSNEAVAYINYTDILKEEFKKTKGRKNMVRYLEEGFSLSITYKVDF